MMSVATQLQETNIQYIAKMPKRGDRQGCEAPSLSNH